MSVSVKLCVSVIIINADKKVLLVREKDGTLNVPSGHVEPGESPYRAAVRELFEETGLADDFDDSMKFVDIKPIGDTFLETKTGGYLTRTYYGYTNRSVLKTQKDDDILEVVWMDPSDLFKVNESELRNPLVKPKVKIGCNSYCSPLVGSEYYISCDIDGNVKWG